MNEPTDLDARATLVANRLRMLQAEVAASADDETRLVLLSDGLSREVQGVPPESRARFVGLLLEHFESKGGPAGAAVATGASGAPAPAPAAPLTALQHAEALAAAWPKLADAERAQIEARLRAAGITRPAPAVAPPPPPAPAAPAGPSPAPAVAAAVGVPVAPASAEAWRRAIQAGPTDALDPARLGELGVTLAEMVLGKDGLHEILWKIWKAMVPQWDDPRGSTLRAAAKGFAAGTVPPDKLAAEALSFKRFVMALLLGTQAFSKEYARDHLTRFSPDAIKSFANVGWGGKEKVYWLYYEEQMTKLGLASADDHLQLTSLILDQLGQNVRAYLGNK
jgi:hypothetical protein